MSFAGLFIDLLVAGLLAITIGYCAILNRRLKKMRADEETMRAVITELVKSTETAERAILGLRATASECNKTISARISEARDIVGHLDRSVAAGRHHTTQTRATLPATVVPPAHNGQLMPTPADLQAQIARQVQMGHEELSRRMATEARLQAAQPVQPPQPVNDYPGEQPRGYVPPVAAPAPPPNQDSLYGDLEASLAEIARRNRRDAA